MQRGHVRWAPSGFTSVLIRWSLMGFARGGRNLSQSSRNRSMGPQRTHRTHPSDPEGQPQNSHLFHYWVFYISVMIQPNILMLNTNLRNCFLFYYILTEYCTAARVLCCWVSMVTHNGQAWKEAGVFVNIICQLWDFSGDVQQGSYGRVTPGSHHRPLEEVRGQPLFQLDRYLRILTL